MDCRDICAIVTGAAGGLGGRFTLELLRAGARVAAGDANAAGLRALKKQARSEGLDPPFLDRLDVTDESSVRAFVDRAEEALGPVDVLINSAGILRDGLLVQPDGDTLRTMTVAQWRQVLDVNLTGPFLMTREVTERMIARRNDREPAGVVVNLSSVARVGNPGQANYAASKSGLDAATRTWALELAPYGIRVAGVAPGVTRTSFLEGISGDRLDELLRATPLGRPGEPEEIWAAVRFILECDYFTGRVLEVDGGTSMGHGGSSPAAPAEEAST